MSTLTRNRPIFNGHEIFLGGRMRQRRSRSRWKVTKCVHSRWAQAATGFWRWRLKRCAKKQKRIAKKPRLVRVVPSTMPGAR